jgi:hypothetical protein
MKTNEQESIQDDFDDDDEEPLFASVEEMCEAWPSCGDPEFIKAAQEASLDPDTFHEVMNNWKLHHYH